MKFLTKKLNGYTFLISLHQGNSKKASVKVSILHVGIQLSNLMSFQPGNGYGKTLMEYVSDKYKNKDIMFLACEPEMKTFYEPFGFKEAGIYMSRLQD